MVTHVHFDIEQHGRSHVTFIYTFVFVRYIAWFRPMLCYDAAFDILLDFGIYNLNTKCSRLEFCRYFMYFIY